MTQPIRISIETTSGHLPGRIERDEIIITVMDAELQNKIRASKIGKYSHCRSAGIWIIPPEKLSQAREWAKNIG